MEKSELSEADIVQAGLDFALDFAIERADLKMTRKALQAGANPHGKSYSSDPLPLIMRPLGKIINSIYNGGWSYDHCAKLEEIIDLLTQYGANILENQNGFTYLSLVKTFQNGNAYRIVENKYAEATLHPIKTKILTNAAINNALSAGHDVNVEEAPGGSRNIIITPKL